MAWARSLPPMAATVMVFDTLGYPKDHPDLVIAKRAVRKLLADNGDFAYFQPCLSPFWDTALACHALMEAGRHGRGADRPTRARLDRRAPGPGHVVGDWASGAAGLRARRLGRSSTATTTTPTSTTPRRSCARCTAPIQSAIGTPSTGASNGCSACKAGTAAGARSTPTTPTTTSTTSRSPITALCSIRRPPT